MTREQKKIKNLILKGINEFPKILKEKDRAFKEKEKAIKAFLPLSKWLLKEIKRSELRESKTLDPIDSIDSKHQWRLCPSGQHWVTEHLRSAPVSSKNPNGKTVVEGHCRLNRGKKDELHFAEILKISKTVEPGKDWYPNASPLGYSNGAEFDREIAIWTQYWNEVLQPESRLEPNFIKALIASESGFRKEISTPIPNKKNVYARGLLQLTDESIKILANENGELKDHLVEINRDEAITPSGNISAGVRWLFHKQKLASHRLKRDATWQESLIEYKGYMAEYKKNPNKIPNGISNFVKKYDEIRELN